jgi:hypothetical protein
MSEMVPTKLRATGYGVATTLGLALFGGFTPLVAEWISHNVQDKAAPSGWLMLLAMCSLVSIYLLGKRKIAMKI